MAGSIDDNGRVVTRLHLWCLPEPGPGLDRLSQRAEALLSHEDRLKHQAMSAEDRARRFRFGRMLLREALSFHFSCGPEELVFGENANGKLFLVSPERAGWDFCISHSPRETVVAVAQSRGVGIDIEESSRQETVMKIALRLYPAAERRQFEAQAGGVGAEMALSLWTLKESVTKAVGSTIWQGVGDTAFELGGADLAWLTKPPMGSPENWNLLLGRFRQHHRFAAAVWERTERPDLLDLQIHQLGVDGPISGIFEVEAAAPKS